MNLNLASQLLDVLSFFLVQPELARVLLGRKRLSRIAEGTRKVALLSSWVLQKSVIKTRFRLDRNPGPIVTRQAFYSLLRYQFKLSQQMPEGDKERSDHLWLNMKELLQVMASKDPDLQQLLDAGEFEKAMKKILSQSGLNLEKPAIFEVSTPRDWMLTFRRFALSFLWISIPTALMWWLITQLWSKAVPRWGCAALLLATITAFIVGGLYRLHLRSVIGDDLSDGYLSTNAQLPEIDDIKIKRLYWHYRFNKLIYLVFGIGFLLVVVLLSLHVAEILALDGTLVNVLAGLIFGVALSLSFTLLRGAVALPVFAVLSAISWVAVLGAQEKVSHIMVTLGIVCFGIARLLSAI